MFAILWENRQKSLPQPERLSRPWGWLAILSYLQSLIGRQLKGCDRLGPSFVLQIRISRGCYPDENAHA
jgi:hypothetical protein